MMVVTVIIKTNQKNKVNPVRAEADGSVPTRVPRDFSAGLGEAARGGWLLPRGR
jgi:hypothetical protein